jgi:hypothetical protein
MRTAKKFLTKRKVTCTRRKLSPTTTTKAKRPNCSVAALVPYSTRTNRALTRSNLSLTTKRSTKIMMSLMTKKAIRTSLCAVNDVVHAVAPRRVVAARRVVAVHLVVAAPRVVAARRVAVPSAAAVHLHRLLRHRLLRHPRVAALRFRVVDQRRADELPVVDAWHPRPHAAAPPWRVVAQSAVVAHPRLPLPVVVLSRAVARSLVVVL